MVAAADHSGSVITRAAPASSYTVPDGVPERTPNSIMALSSRQPPSAPSASAFRLSLLLTGRARLASVSSIPLAHSCSQEGPGSHLHPSCSQKGPSLPLSRPLFWLTPLRTNTHDNSPSLSLSLSHTHTHTHTRARARTHTHIYTHTRPAACSLVFQF